MYFYAEVEKIACLVHQFRELRFWKLSPQDETNPLWGCSVGCRLTAHGTTANVRLYKRVAASRAVAVRLVLLAIEEDLVNAYFPCSAV